MKKKKSIFSAFPVLLKIPKEKFPKHIFIIPDGNGRWAKAHNTFVTNGHKKGFQVAEKIIRDLSKIEAVRIVTLWGFAVDNWKRSEREINGLMLIFQQVVKKILKEFLKDNRRFMHIGRKNTMPKQLIDLLDKAETETKNNTGQILCLALDFGGEDQNIRMVEKARHISTNIPTTQELLWQLRDGEGVISPADLLIRTSGEYRTSDVGWLNGSSTELFFIDKLFPDITTGDIVDALVNFSQRERKFGGRNST
jgi:undecaprenyl diphosphate synthase